MLMPPDAEPVMPASTFTAMASEISGLSPPSCITLSRISRKALSDAITAPKPTRLAVLKIGTSDAFAPLSRLCFSCGSLRQFMATSSNSADTSPAITAQMPRTSSTSVSPYTGRARNSVSMRGITTKVNSRFTAITVTSGSSATGNDGGPTGGFSTGSSIRSKPSPAAFSRNSRSGANAASGWSP